MEVVNMWNIMLYYSSKSIIKSRPHLLAIILNVML